MHVGLGCRAKPWERNGGSYTVASRWLKLSWTNPSLQSLSLSLPHCDLPVTQRDGGGQEFCLTRARNKVNQDNGNILTFPALCSESDLDDYYSTVRHVWFRKQVSLRENSA